MAFFFIPDYLTIFAAKSERMELLDGKETARIIKLEIAQQVKARKAEGKKIPHLAAILVGTDGGSMTYVANKLKSCEECGFESTLMRYDDSVSEEVLLNKVKQLNEDKSIDGFIVQLPLPAHIDAQKVIEAISPAKDIDGFHIASAGALMTGMPGFWPCTPYGCMKMLESIGYDLKGKHAVVIGRSNIVGKPMALMLLQKNATVTICHSASTNLKAMTLQADVIVAAVGKIKILTADMVKPGAVVIDVGMNRNDEGKLCGDVDFEGVSQVAGYISPVPGGVGPMTITMLLVNTLEAAERA